MKRLVYIIVFALGLTACYDDKGSYDYHDICEVNIEALPSRPVAGWTATTSPSGATASTKH